MSKPNEPQRKTTFSYINFGTLIVFYFRTQIKITESELAQRIDAVGPIRDLVESPEFVSPEIINRIPIGFQSDMWSIGVICYVL